MAEKHSNGDETRGQAETPATAASPWEAHARAVLDPQGRSGFVHQGKAPEPAIQAGLDPAIAAAWAELGCLVTEDEGHLMTAGDAVAWRQAVLRARGEDERDDSLAVLIQEVAAGLELLVGQTLLNDGDEGPALREVETLQVADATDGGRTTAVVLSTLMAWLAGARESGTIDAAAVLTWVDNSLSRLPAAVARGTAGIIGYPVAPEEIGHAETIAEVHDRLDPMFAPAMIWLAAGLAATAGGGDAHWLRQFDAP